MTRTMDPRCVEEVLEAAEDLGVVPGRLALATATLHDQLVQPMPPDVEAAHLARLEAVMGRAMPAAPRTRATHRKLALAAATVAAVLATGGLAAAGLIEPVPRTIADLVGDAIGLGGGEEPRGEVGVESQSIRRSAISPDERSPGAEGEPPTPREPDRAGDGDPPADAPARVDRSRDRRPTDESRPGSGRASTSSHATATGPAGKENGAAGRDGGGTSGPAPAKGTSTGGSTGGAASPAGPPGSDPSPAAPPGADPGPGNPPGTGNPGNGNPDPGNPQGTGNPGNGNPDPGTPQGNPDPGTPQGNPDSGSPGNSNPGNSNPGNGNPGNSNPGNGNPDPGTPRGPTQGNGNPGNGNPDPGTPRGPTQGNGNPDPGTPRGPKGAGAA